MEQICWSSICSLFRQNMFQNKLPKHFDFFTTWPGWTCQYQSRHPARARAPLPLPDMLFLDMANVYKILSYFKRGISLKRFKRSFLHNREFSWTFDWTSRIQCTRLKVDIWFERRTLFINYVALSNFIRPKNAAFKLIHSSQLKLVFDSACVKCDVWTGQNSRHFISVQRLGDLNDVIKSAKCVGLGPRTTNAFYTSIWQPRNHGYWCVKSVKQTHVYRNIRVLKLIYENERTLFDTLLDKCMCTDLKCHVKER